MPFQCLVSARSNSRLGELLWIGTNTRLYISADGQFSCIGSYFLWLKTSNNPAVRWFNWGVGYDLLRRSEPAISLETCEPEYAERIRKAISIVLDVYPDLKNEFFDPNTTITFDESSPQWYIDILNSIKATGS